jgi:hypothetical protein
LAGTTKNDARTAPPTPLEALKRTAGERPAGEHIIQPVLCFQCKKRTGFLIVDDLDELKPFLCSRLCVQAFLNECKAKVKQKIEEKER